MDLSAASNKPHYHNDEDKADFSAFVWPSLQ